MSVEELSDELTGMVWHEWLKWKRGAIANKNYDHSACTAPSADEWARCVHCRNEVKAVTMEIGRRDAGEDWMEAPFGVESL